MSATEKCIGEIPKALPQTSNSEAPQHKLRAEMNFFWLKQVQ